MQWTLGLMYTSCRRNVYFEFYLKPLVTPDDDHDFPLFFNGFLNCGNEFWQIQNIVTEKNEKGKYFGELYFDSDEAVGIDFLMENCLKDNSLDFDLVVSIFSFFAKG